MSSPSNAIASIPSGMHRIGLFPTQIILGDLVQLDIKLVVNVFKELGFKKPEGDTDTLVILPLAVSGDAVDFHLSFATTAGYSKQCHFCIRLEGRQNECLYEHYKMVKNDSGLHWSYVGPAGQGDAKVIIPHISKGVVFSAYPLNQFLAVIPKWISDGKAELIQKDQPTFAANGKRSGTYQQWTLQLRS